jgi:cytochrome c oxidase subunit 4
MAYDPKDSQRLPGVGERIRRLAENPVPTGGMDAQFAHAGGHDAAEWHDDGHHPTARTYILVGLFLTAITAVEVWVYYIPAFVASAAFVPALLIMSAVKFVTVIMVYMHLKYDHKLFRALFGGPLLIAFVTLFALMFLFGKLAVRLGVLA